MARCRVVLERVVGLFLPITRFAAPAVRHLTGKRKMRVDPGRAEFELGGNTQRCSAVPRPNRGCEPVIRLVDEADDILQIPKPTDRNDRAEYLLALDLVLREGVGYDSGAEEKAATREYGPSTNDLDVRLPARTLDKACDTVALPRGDAGSHLDIAVVWITDSD